MKKIKSVLFRLEMEGEGIVNFDSSNQRFIWNQQPERDHYFKENILFGKKNFYRDTNGDITYRNKISAGCLRHAFFADENMFHSPAIMNIDDMLYGTIASRTGMIRGYLFARQGGTIKRKSVLSVSSAELTNNAVSTIDTCGRSGEKQINDITQSVDEKTKDNSFFLKESIGNTRYKAKGSIDLLELQFLSSDNAFDRCGFNDDKFDTFKRFFTARYPDAVLDKGYFKINGTAIDRSETGIKFDSKTIHQMVKEFVMNILSTEITRSDAWANVVSLQIKLVENPITDRHNVEQGWITITSPNDFPEFEIDDRYIKSDEEAELELREATRLFKKAEAERKKAEADRKNAIRESKKAAKNKEQE